MIIRESFYLVGNNGGNKLTFPQSFFALIHFSRLIHLFLSLPFFRTIRCAKESAKRDYLNVTDRDIFVLRAFHGLSSFKPLSPRTTHRPECHDPLKYLEEVVRARGRRSGRVERGRGETHPSWQLSVVLAFVYILPHLREESLYFYPL